MAEFVLYDHQKKAVEAGIDFFKNNKKKDHHEFQIQPTGSGKSLCIANMAKELGEPTLILQPSKEILVQNYKKLLSYGFRAGIYSASAGYKFIDQITYATIGSIVNKPHLFSHFKHLIIDECDLVSNNSETMYNQFIKSIEGVKLLGLSVAPESTIELIGDIFGYGFIGKIEDAFTLLLNNGHPAHLIDNLEVLFLDGLNIKTRGWTGNCFAWKECKKLIRHNGKNCKMRTIVAHSNTLTLTENHSVYRAKTSSNRTEKTQKLQNKIIEIDCPLSTEISIGDTLIQDDGANWIEAEREYDMVEFVCTNMPRTRAKASVDLSNIPLSSLFPHTTGNQKSSMARRWKKTNSLPLKTYRELMPILPELSVITIEGSKCKIAPKIKLSDWAYIIGFYIGDGWIDKAVNIGRIAFAVEDKMQFIVLKELKIIPGVTWEPLIAPKYGKTSKSVEIRANNIFVIELLKYIGLNKPCHKKTIPGECLLWDKESRINLLHGLIDSDGYISKDKGNKSRVTFTTTSHDLCNSLLSLLRSLGITGSLHTRKQSKGGVIDGRQITGSKTSYSVQWSAFAQMDNNDKHKGLRKKFNHDIYKFNELIATSNIPSVSYNYVYDIEMEGHPSFVASGFLVHNTATPYRLTSGFNGAMLKFINRTNPRIFNKCNYYIQNSTLFNQGYLAKLKYFSFDVIKREMLSVNKSGTDFTKESLQAHYRQINMPQITIHYANRLLDKRKNLLVFCSLVSEAEAVSKGIPGSVVISSDTPPEIRAKHLTQFLNGTIKCVVNCNVLSVGFDFPGLECILIARSTMSLRWYYQAAGRGFRRSPGKEDCWIVDLGGNISFFGKFETMEIREINGKLSIWNNSKQLTNVAFTKK